MKKIMKKNIVKTILKKLFMTIEEIYLRIKLKKYY